MRSHNAPRRAFTLIELLVVIAIIGILASLSLVTLSRIRVHSQVVNAQRQMQALFNAINEYHSDTGMFPVSDATRNVAATSHGDFTFGGTSLDATFGASGNWSSNNSEVMAILMDRDKYPATGAPTANAGHVKNTQQKQYLVQVDLSYGMDGPGLGQDLVYRDPWGNPYIISFDLNYDDKCRDALYQKSSVSQDAGATGFYGLQNSSDPTGVSDQFEYPGGVMIWSLGPDKKADGNHANAGSNKDNVLSWK